VFDYVELQAREGFEHTVRSCQRLIGEILITCGVVVALFTTYMLWGTAVRERAAQQQFARELSSQWAAPGLSLAMLDGSGRLVLGRPFAIMRIPALGADWRFAVVQGTGLAQLALGPGHVPGTQRPGQLGNFAVAAHRVTAGNPFYNVPSLKPGDLVYVQTSAGTYTYEITARPVWTWPGNTAVLAPAPGRPGQPPRRAWITLITCDPAWSGTSRVVVVGELVKRPPRPATDRS
jgi:sortase A